MATVFKFYDGTNTLDLTGSDIKLDHAYLPQYATPPGDGTIPPDVIENVPVIITATSADNLAAIIQNVDLLRRNAARYMQELDNEAPVWWHQKLDGETGERRALVKSIRLALERNPYAAAPPVTQMINGSLMVTRHPYWERTASRDMPEATPAAAVSLLYDYTAAGSVVAAHDIVGNPSARMSRFLIRPEIGDTLERLWIGIRSADFYGQTVSNFVPVWELEDGSNNASESGVTDEADATASDGNKVQVVETDLEWDDTWQRVLTYKLNDATVDKFSDQFGKHLFLLRAKVTAGTWETRARFGYGIIDYAEHVQHDPIEIAATSWNIKELAVQTIPIRNLRVVPLSWFADHHEADLVLSIWARRTSGAGNLELDCVCPIPVDEGYLIASEFTSVGSIPQRDGLVVGNSPLDETNVLARDDTLAIFERHPVFSHHNFRLPPGDGRMVIAYARASSSDITDVIDINITDHGKYYERWDGFRGAE